MSENDALEVLRQVQKPDINLRGTLQGTPPPNGPRNLVEAWGVVPFHQLDGCSDWAGLGDEVYVLTLLASDARLHPYRFCLSPEAVEDMITELQKLLGKLEKI